MYFYKNWSSDANSTGTIGSGWTYDGTTASIVSGAIKSDATSTLMVRRTTSGAVANEIYAECVITAVGADSEVGPILATGSSSSYSAASLLMARYDASATKFQLMYKPPGSTSLTNLGTSLTQAISVPATLRIELHSVTAKMYLNGVQIGTTVSISSYSANTYAYPGIRLKNNVSSRVGEFKAGDYGVTSGGTDNGGILENLTAHRYTGSALTGLDYLGIWNGSTVLPTNLSFLKKIPLPFDESPYGPGATDYTNPPSLPVGFVPTRTVNVSNIAQLSAAMLDATAGDLIELANGMYNDKLIMLNKSGNASHPIVVRGSRNAVVHLGTWGSSGDYGSGYPAQLDGCNYVHLLGFRISHGPKGLILDESNNCVLRGLQVDDVEQEAVHLRNYSSNNVVEQCTIFSTGNKSPGFGEAMYVGTATSNWGASTSRTGGLPDPCNNNILRHNYAHDFTGEGVDVKEGTIGTIIEWNYFDGNLLNDDNSADTWADIKGNQTIIRYNFGKNTFNGAYSVYDPSAGYGEDNVFLGNVGYTYANGNGPQALGADTTDPAINVKLGDGFGNIIYDNNVFYGSPSLTNVTITPTP